MAIPNYVVGLVKFQKMNTAPRQLTAGELTSIKTSPASSYLDQQMAGILMQKFDEIDPVNGKRGKLLKDAVDAKMAQWEKPTAQPAQVQEVHREAEQPVSQVARTQPEVVPNAKIDASVPQQYLYGRTIAHGLYAPASDGSGHTLFQILAHSDTHGALRIQYSDLDNYLRNNYSHTNDANYQTVSRLMNDWNTASGQSLMDRGATAANKGMVAGAKKIGGLAWGIARRSTVIGEVAGVAIPASQAQQHPGVMSEDSLARAAGYPDATAMQHELAVAHPGDQPKH